LSLPNHGAFHLTDDAAVLTSAVAGLRRRFMETAEGFLIHADSVADWSVGDMEIPWKSRACGPPQRLTTGQLAPST
jgi:hypothetical protein